MHVLSTALFERNSFKNVISTGVMAGNDGRKMSKTYGNYTDPKEILENVGGDALRLYLMGTPFHLLPRMLVLVVYCFRYCQEVSDSYYPY